MHFMGAQFFAPDPLAVGTAYIFLIYGPIGACMFALCQGFFIDIYSGGMHGLFTFLYLIVFFGFWLGSRFFNLQSPKGQMVIVACAMLFKKAFLVVMLATFSQATFFSKSFWWATVGSILCTGVFAPFFFYLCEQLRVMAFELIHDTSKDPL